MKCLIVAVVFLVGTVVCSDPKNVPCEKYINGDTKQICVGGYILSYEAMPMTYMDASAACIARGGFLASIRTEAERQAAMTLLTQNGLMTGDSALVGTMLMGAMLVNADGTTVPATFMILPAPADGQAALLTLNTTISLGTFAPLNATDNATFICKSIYHGNSKVFISGTNSTLLNKTEAVKTCTTLGGKLKSVTKFSKNDRIKTELALRVDMDKNYLIGLSYNATTMKFKWHDNSYSLVRNWCPLEPQIPSTVTRDLCVAARGLNGCWFVQPCSTPSNYICDFMQQGDCKDSKESLLTFVNVIRAEIGKINKHCKACRKHSV